MIRPALPTDAPHIRDIYNHYIAATTATFEEQPISVSELAARLDAPFAAKLPWLVSESDGTIIGYAYATRWKPRSAYRYAVESTIYLAPDHIGRGTGAALFASLIETLQHRGVHCVIAGIAPPNAASIALHEKFGFAKVAHFREVGFKFGRWIDVGYWQLEL